MRNEQNSLYTLATACLVVYLFAGLFWFGFVSALNIIILGLAFAVLLRARDAGAERYGKRRAARIDLLLLTGSLAAVGLNELLVYPFYFGIDRYGVFYSRDYNFSVMLGVMVLLMLAAAVFQYGPDRLRTRVEAAVSALRKVDFG